jgi:formate hydrogenlyase subunit 6/NADH:ubiquinone oxidoreductase subunit I
VGALPALARDARDGAARGRAAQVRGLRPLPHDLPGNCIRLVPGEDDQGNRYPIVYEIDEFRCIFCGMCQEVCPVEAIHVGQHYENAEYTRDNFVYDLDRLMARSTPRRCSGIRRTRRESGE